MQNLGHCSFKRKDNKEKKRIVRQNGLKLEARIFLSNKGMTKT